MADEHEAEVLAAAQEDAESYIASFLEQFPIAIEAQRRKERRFGKSLRKRWRTPINLFKGTLSLSLQLGTEFNDEERTGAAVRGDLMFACLTRLHARSCVLCSEVLALLEAGHASGAYGRWRTLHETAVTAWFISYGDQLLAEKYLAHQAVKDLEDAEQYQKDRVALGTAPIPEARMEELRLRCEQLKVKYGETFDGGYGWASDAVRAKLNHKGRVNFGHLEQAADLDYLRSHYKFASHYIHPTSKGLSYDVGLVKQDGAILSGPSYYGLAEPAVASCSSLRQTTTALIMTMPNQHRLACLMALDEFVRRTSAAFWGAEQQILSAEPR